LIFPYFGVPTLKTCQEYRAKEQQKNNFSRKY